MRLNLLVYAQKQFLTAKGIFVVNLNVRKDLSFLLKRKTTKLKIIKHIRKGHKILLRQLLLLG